MDDLGDDDDDDNNGDAHACCVVIRLCSSPTLLIREAVPLTIGA